LGEVDQDVYSELTAEITTMKYEKRLKMGEVL